MLYILTNKTTDDFKNIFEKKNLTIIKTNIKYMSIRDKNLKNSVMKFKTLYNFYISQYN